MKSAKAHKRLRRKIRIRAKVNGTSARPRLVVFRSNRFTCAQVIDDTTGKVLVAHSDMKDTKKEIIAKPIAPELKRAKTGTVKSKIILFALVVTPDINSLLLVSR